MVDNTINVLLIEDNPADTALIREMLSESKKPVFKLCKSSRLKEGLEKIRNYHVDILLLDLNLPDSHGLETFETANRDVSGLPIVILSAFDDEEVAVKAVKGEAQDYLIKGNVDSNLLSRSILYAIERKSNELELLKYKDHLEEMVEKRTAELKMANEMLKKEIDERKKAEEEIKSSLLEKKILLEEIHNRMENNLETISNLIGLEYSQASNKEPLEIYHDSQNRVKAIALIHERLSKSDDFAIIDFAKYTHDLINYLFRTFAVDKNQIKVEINTHGILLDIDTAVPCGLIVNELVTNSIKHAFPLNENIESHNEIINPMGYGVNDPYIAIEENNESEKNASIAKEIREKDKNINKKRSNDKDLNNSKKELFYCPGSICKININLCLNQNDYILEVEDNGVGLPSDFDFRYSETTGMQMVNALVRQLDGLIDLKKNHGTGFRITFRDFRI